MTRADLAALRALVRLVEHELGERLDRGQLDDHRLIASDARHLQAAAGALRERLDEGLEDDQSRMGASATGEAPGAAAAGDASRRASATGPRRQPVVRTVRRNPDHG